MDNELPFLHTYGVTDMVTVLQIDDYHSVAIAIRLTLKEVWVYDSSSTSLSRSVLAKIKHFMRGLYKYFRRQSIKAPQRDNETAD